MTRERIEDMREVVLPFVKKRLLETNYEGLGESDAKEFEKEFNEILNLAIKALEQEPFKPMVEIDLYSVIKQKYIERDILDKIRAEINKIYNRDGNSFDCLNALDELKEFIDKYKAESEG
jgi:hypothetical protein